MKGQQPQQHVCGLAAHVLFMGLLIHHKLTTAGPNSKLHMPNSPIRNYTYQTAQFEITHAKRPDSKLHMPNSSFEA